jgi:hypothetical protein
MSLPARTINCRTRRVAMVAKKTNEVISVFNCMKDAALFTGVPYTGIVQCCMGVQKSSGGYKWKYIV